MIIANGCPRSGTHLLMSWLASMGLKRAPGIVEAWHSDRALDYRGTTAERPCRGGLEQLATRTDDWFAHGHVHAGCDLAAFRVVTIFRDPRDVLASYSRAYQCSIIDAMRDFCGAPFREVYNGYLPWRGRGPCLRFEDFAKEIVPAQHLYQDAILDNDTATKRLSDWRAVWTDEIEDEWQKLGVLE